MRTLIVSDCTVGFSSVFSVLGYSHTEWVTNESLHHTGTTTRYSRKSARRPFLVLMGSILPIRFTAGDALFLPLTVCTVLADMVKYHALNRTEPN